MNSQEVTSTEQGLPKSEADRRMAIATNQTAQRVIGRELEKVNPVFDRSGVLMTPGDQVREREFVREHGHGSNETATKI